MTKIFYAAARIGQLSQSAIEHIIGGPVSRHVTLIYSKVWFPYFAKTDIYPIIIEPPYTMIKLQSHKVLSIKSPILEQRHKDLRLAGGSWDFPEYIPHITLKNRTIAAIPSFPITLICEYFGTWEEKDL